MDLDTVRKGIGGNWKTDKNRPGSRRVQKAKSACIQAVLEAPMPTMGLPLNIDS